jgi:hypothetical protein
MSFPEPFLTASKEKQSEIIDLGLMCWDLLQKESLKQNDIQLSTFVEKAKEDAYNEGKLHAASELLPKSNV